VLRDSAARRYAQAAFEIARDRGEIETWEANLQSLAAVLATPEAQAFVANRQVGPTAKEQFLRDAAGEVTSLVWNLVRLLTAKGRLALLPQIAEAFQELVDDYRGIAHADVLTAVPLDEQGQQELAARLSQITGKSVLIEAHQDPQILGGLVARIGDRLIDGSTRSKLHALRRELAGSR
jgi:F-type H+-transporting ATPase subunit delta